MKKILLLISICIAGLCTVYAGPAPTFENNFANYLTDTTPDEFGRVETVFNICIDVNASLMDNIRRLFYPNPIAFPGCASSRWGLLRDVIRVLWGAVLFIFLLRNGISFVLNAGDEEKLSTAKKSILYILYGAILFFGSTWILSAINIGDMSGTTEFAQNLENNVLFQALAIFKTAAFFAAIIMIIIYGFRFMAAHEEEEKIETAKSGLLNVIIALVLIKIIDYVFYIASTPSFTESASQFIIQIAKVLWRILWWAIMWSVIYAGFLLLTSAGDEERIAKAKNLIFTIFLVWVVVFLFLLIIYQIFKEFA